MTMASPVAAIIAPVMAVVTPVVMTVVASLVVAAIIPVIVVVVAFAVTRRVIVHIPVVTDEIDRPAAGAVAVAMLVPMLGVPRWDAQIVRRQSGWSMLDHDRLRIKQGRGWETPNVDTAVKAGLADVDREARGVSLRDEGSNGQQSGKNIAFHEAIFRVAGVPSNAV